jgi:hypothetical protein
MASENAISVFQNNTLIVTCVVTPVTGVLETLDGYTPTMTVKDEDGTEVISNEGSTNGMTITHTISADDNDIDPDDYDYDITIENDPIRYTVRKDKYYVKEV